MGREGIYSDSLALLINSAELQLIYKTAPIAPRHEHHENHENRAAHNGDQGIARTAPRMRPSIAMRQPGVSPRTSPTSTLNRSDGCDA